MKLPDEVRKEYEAWLRSVCFQKPTPVAYGLANDAWQAAYRSGIEAGVRAGLEEGANTCQRERENGRNTADDCADAIRSLPIEPIVERVMKEGK